MQDIYKKKMMMIREFEHFVRFQLIEMMKMKVHLIQFDLIVNVIQMKSMKVNSNMRNMTTHQFQYFDIRQYSTGAKTGESSGD
jgi:hypothetical protein